MTPETYTRALELQAEINALLAQKEIWELATGICTDKILLQRTPQKNRPLEADTTIIPFDPLRTSVLAYLEDEIAPLQAEFDEL